jgi:hypothetical protein
MWNEAAGEKWDPEDHEVTLWNSSVGSKPWNLILFHTPTIIGV